MDDTVFELWDCLGVHASDLYELRDMLRDSKGWRVFARLMEASSDAMLDGAQRADDSATAWKTVGACVLIGEIKRLATDVQNAIVAVEKEASQK